MIRPVFLIIFLIVGLLFTVGYSFLPIITFTNTVSNNNINASVYINKLEVDVEGKSNTVNYSDLNINSNYKSELDINLIVQCNLFDRYMDKYAYVEV